MITSDNLKGSDIKYKAAMYNNIAAFVFYIILYLSSFLGIKKAMTFTGYRSKSSIGISFP